MSGITACPKCGGKLRLPPSVSPGTKVSCPHCSAALAVGSAQQTATAAPPTAAPRATDDPSGSKADSKSGNPPHPPGRAGHDNRLVYIVGGIGAALVFLLSVALVLLLSRGPQVAEKPADPGARESDEDGTRRRPEAATVREGAREAPAVTASSVEAIPKTNVPQEAATKPTSAATSLARAESAGPGSRPPAEPVDLLAMIDPARDLIGGSWTRQGSSLACSGGERWSLVVPQPPPAAYRWTIDIEWTSGNSCLGLLLIVDGHPAVAKMDSRGHPVPGMGLFHGLPANPNQFTRAGEGRPITIACTVYRSGIQIACNRKLMFTWRGSAERLPYNRTLWGEPPTGRLALVSPLDGGVRIDKMTLEELDPTQAIPQAGPAAMAGGPAGFPPPWAFGIPPQSMAGGPAQFQPPGPFGTPPQSNTSPASPINARPQGSAVSQAAPPTEEKNARPQGSASSQAAAPTEELPEAVQRSKDSVCFIKHPLGSGTGFVVGENLVATNAHVVDGAYVGEIECSFSASAAVKCPASRVLYEDAVRDLCLLEVRTDQTPVPIVADYRFKQGERVVIVGNPSIGETDIVLRDAVTKGTMSAMVHTDQCDFYQIDGAVNPGSSGGPALNYDGALVAVIAMKATERGETEIRQALTRLDGSFSRRFGSTVQKGIAFGIPVGDLTRAIEEVNQQTESAATSTGDRHLANVLLQRMSFVGGVNLLKLQSNVPPAVRRQARELEIRIRTRKISATMLKKMERVPLLPETEARKLRAALESAELQKVLRVSETGMQQSVEHLSASEHFDPTIASDFEFLLRAVLRTKRSAENPPSTYKGYARAVNSQIENLKDRILRLEERLNVAKAAYEE